MMADRRRRSPSGPSRTRKTSSRSSYPRSEPDAPPQYGPIPPVGTRSRGPPEPTIYSSSSGSSSYEIIDISRSFPPNRSGIATFFTAPSERRLRRRRSNRVLRHSNANSSSESVGDLAYGHGYLKRPKLRRVRSRKGKEIDRERYTERERERERFSERERYEQRNAEKYSDRERGEKSGLSRAATDASILAVGAGLAKLARDQNKKDLKSSRGKTIIQSTKEFGRREEGMSSRGVGPSKFSHGSDTADEEGWESASDAESESSVDSRLAFGAESQGGWFGRKIFRPQSRKSSVVDPRLFGPANSLHGVVTQPVGFGEVSWTASSDFGQRDSYTQTQGRAESSVASGSLPPMQHVYPYATEDATKFDAARSSVVSGPEPYMSSRPAPVPIQHPQPITPVSQSVYEPMYATKSETGTGILKKKAKESSSGRSKSLAEAALIGVAGAAVGAALSEKKDRRRDDERESREDERTPRRKDSERKETKDDRKRDKRESPERDDRKEKPREKDRGKDSTEDRKDKKREKRRDDSREETRDERRERRRDERRSERGDDRDDRRSERSDDRYESRRTKSEVGSSSEPINDVFKYQLENDTTATLNNEPATSHGRVQSVPTVVVVEREPSFARKRSSSIKDQPSSSKSETGRKDYSESWDAVTARSEPGRKDYAERDEREKRRRDSRDAPLQKAEDIYEKERRFTAPIAAAAVTAAIAAEGYRESRSDKRRDERRSERREDYDDYDSKPRDKDSKREYDDYDSSSRDKKSKRESRDYDDYNSKSRDKDSKRSREPERDPVQEEADRAYREIVMARKIASQVIRSRSPSPNRSVVDRYPEKEEVEPVRIVTPPGMDDRKKKGPYDAPNADFQLDYVIDHPKELRRFSLPSRSRDRSNSDAPYLKKDPDADLPRPFLNLVLPTPSPSPMLEKQIARSEPARKPRPQSEPVAAAASDVIIGPRGNVIQAASSASAVSKGVTWGQNETKHFEVESPSEHRDEFVSSPEIRARDDPAEQPKSLPWDTPVEATKPRSRDSSVDKPKTTTRDSPVEQPKPSTASKRGGWGAIAAGIIGAGAGTAAATASETSKSSKTSKTKENEKKEENPYEYRGIVVEPESPPKTQRQRSPPTTGPKPTASQTSQISRIPGAFDDDLDFTATVAAGLQDTGFDPNIVINDPKFRRRDSPPGSNELAYRAPYAESVSDMGSIARDAPPKRDGRVPSEVSTTSRDWPNVSPDEEDASTKLSKKDQKKRDKAAKRQSGDFTPFEDEISKSREIDEEPEPYFETKLSKKEQKQRDKAAKRQSGDFTPVEDESSRTKDIIEEPEPYFETKLSKKEQKKRDKEARRHSSQADDVRPYDETPVVAEIVEEPESYFEEPSKKSKKSKKASSYEDETEELSRDNRKVTVPIDAFDDLTRNGEDEWSEKKSKKKSKRDSERYDSPSRSVVSDVASPIERSTSLSRKSKDKSKRKSEQYEPEPTEVSLPPSTPSETSRDGDFDDSRSTRKSSYKDSADRGESRSVVSADASRYDDDEPRKSKRKSKSRDDFDDTRSVASAPARDDYEDSKQSKKKDKDKDKKGSGFFSLFGSKSEVGSSTRDDSPKRSKDDSEEARKKSKKSKRSSMPDASSLYGDVGAQSINDLSRIFSNGKSNGNGVYHDDDDRSSRDSSKKKSRSRSESTSSKKDSFLAKAGTLGAGVGLAGAAVAIAAQLHQQSKADNAYKSNKTAERARSRSSSRPQYMEDIVDPEIAERQFRPSIDPQYGDLLPLPPSDPVSPNVEPVDDLPDLPDSRSNTPEMERLQQERAMASIRRTISDAPMKSPSHSAVPLKFMMGNRSGPSSPALTRPSPLQSPAGSQESLHFPRTRPRPSSWESTKEYKPLYLVESNRRGSNVQQQELEGPLPALPPSEGSRSSSLLDSSDEATFEDAEQYHDDMDVQFSDALSINTGLAKHSAELLDSQQSTPKASVFQYLDADQQDEPLPKSVDAQSLPSHRPVSAFPEEHHDSHAKTAAEAIAGAALVSSIGYFASSPVQRPTDKSFLEELPSHTEVPRQPSPVDSMTKDRSSYLLQSSPMSRQAEEDAAEAREEESPTTHQRRDRDVLTSIREWDQDDAFEHAKDVQPAIEEERERALDTLSGSTHDDPAVQRGEEDLTEPADEFALTKSKKDKKRDKKKGKGLTRSSTQEDYPLPESVQEPLEELPIPVEPEPSEEFPLPKSKKDKKKGKSSSRSSTQDVFSFQEPESSQEIDDLPSTSAPVDSVEEFSLPKSKKEKKKGKGLSRSSTGDNFTYEEPSREITEEPSGALVNDPVDEYALPKSKKDKKKDKKKGKSTTSWEEEDEPVSQPLEESREATALVSQDTPAEDDLFPAKTKKSKKDKKNRKSLSWESEEATSSTRVEEPVQETGHHKLADVAVPAALGAIGVAAYQTFKHNDKPEALPQSNEEEMPLGKKKAASVFNFEDRDEGPSAVDVARAPLTIASEPKDIEQPSEKTRDIAPQVEPESQDATTFDDFAPSSSKKNKKKKGKSISSWEPKQEAVIPSQTTEDPDPVSEFSMPGSKKSKKKGKKSQSWSPEEDVPAEILQEAVEPAIDTIAYPQPPISLKSDEKPGDRDLEELVAIEPAQQEGPSESKSTILDQDSHVPSQKEVSESDMAPSLELESLEPSSKSEETFEDFTRRPSKKGKKKSRKSQQLDDEPQTEERAEILSGQSADPEALGTPTKTTSVGPTPTDGPDHVQASTTVLPIAAAGAAVLLGEHFEKGSNDDTPIVSKDIESEPSQPTGPEVDLIKSPPDGLKAGYDSDQLSLAKRLQEEFGASGSKKSKKDKKKRQSLPADSDYDFSRSRDLNEGLEDHDRARSLSMRPSPASESNVRPMSEDRKNVYSEDQLELARQLKAEFEGGNKKSKKDKKKRQDLSRTSTQDDAFQDLAAEDSETVTNQQIEDATAQDPIQATRDGFEAGYQEDQLSLARQLQAEFGSGSKKSKKDKKRRSTSQTPLQESEQADYFDETSQAPIEQARDLEAVDTPGSSEVDREASRDGLAVGYNAEQLELARQLKEEFSSGSSKSKKGKKDKKRQSLLRNTTEDDFSSDYTPGERSESRDVDPKNREAAEAGLNEPAVAEPDNYPDAFMTKKSKKDKKGKKRDSSVPSAAPGIVSETIPKDFDEQRDVDIQREAVEGGSSEPAPTEPDDEFAFTTKKSKKDKKGKKWEDSTPASESDIPLGESTKATDENGSLEETQKPTSRFDVPEPVAEPEDEFAFTTKKSKKDKKGKKRESLPPASLERATTSEIVSQDTNEQATIDDVQPSVNEVDSTEPPSQATEDDFGAFELTRKKSKKDKKGKKRESLTPAAIEPEILSMTAERQLHEPGTMETVQPQSTASASIERATEYNEQGEQSGIPVESAVQVADNPEDEFSLTRKKSKKDKKGKQRESIPQSTTDEASPPNDFGTSVEALHNTRGLSSEETNPVQEPITDNVEDDWSAPPKKSKKDKKKRQSLAMEDTPDQPPPEAESVPLHASEEPSTGDTTAISSAAEAANEPEDDFGFSTKKSKKDKKKRQSLLQSSTLDDTPVNHDETTLPRDSMDRGVGDEFAADARVLEDNPDDGFEVSSKKSKKDKKKRQSTQETAPLAEAPRKLEILTSTPQVQPASEDVESSKEEPVLETEAHDVQPTTPEAISEAKVLDEQPAQAIEENLEDQFENFAFTTKKSKKDKKKRKDSTLPESDEPSGVSTPIDPIQDEPLVAAAPPIAGEVASENINNMEENQSRDLDETLPTGTVVQEISEDPAAEEWGSFSTKTSKKDKKKRKSGISTPIDEPTLQAEIIKSNDPIAVEMPKEISEQVVDSVDEVWGSPTTKKSKKDEKNRNSGLSTPIDDVSLQDEPALQESVALEKSEEPLSAQAPAEEEWNSLTTKKSKRDKKRNKSGLSTPLEETISESEPVTQRASTDIAEPTEQKPEDPIDDSWGSFTTKGSKKDKKRNKSGLSTPSEERTNELLDQHIPEDSATLPESHDQIPNFDVTSQAEIPTLENLMPQPEEPADDEWGSFTSKKSKKDRKKNKSGLSTPFEAILAPEPSTLQKDNSEIERPKNQLEELLAGGVFTTKKSKDKKLDLKILPGIEDSTPDALLQDTQHNVAEMEPRNEDSYSEKHSVEQAHDEKHHLELPIVQEAVVQGTPVEMQLANQVDAREAEINASSVPDSTADEWDSFTTKKSKKGKKTKSGVSTPLEEAPRPVLLSQEEEVGDSSTPAPVEDAEEEDWGSFSTKKSKKDKKRKSEVPIPLEEVQQPEPSTTRDLSEAAIPPELVSEGQDFSVPQTSQEEPQDGFEFTTKKSKKDKKKRKSGLSTPIEDPVLPTEQIHQIERAEVDEPRLETSSRTALDSSQNTPSAFPAAKVTGESSGSVGNDQEMDDATFDFVTKKSKKDKKKRKSGLSTPVDETLPLAETEKSFQDLPTQLDEPELQPLPTTPDLSRDVSQPLDTVEEAANDDFEFSTKKSKKDKKKRTSASSTPLEESLPPVEPEQSSLEPTIEEPITQSQRSEREIPVDTLEEVQSSRAEAIDDGLDFATKKSKKDKKGKRASRLNSDSGPIVTETPSAPSTEHEDKAQTTFERFTESPGPHEDDNRTVNEPVSAPTIHQEDTTERKADHTDEFAISLGRKASKKDKRKRQATVADINAGPGGSKAPLTSWADEVEEAEVEREVPVIDDIAKDESLSHIASTTETTPIDDFTRPTKKGKKGKKRHSGVTTESSVDESYRQPIREDASEETTKEHSDIPILAATGAALAGAALLSSQPKQETASTSKNDSKTKEADVPTPARKLSKKEKRKQSIDRRAPSNDPFDDPALWEGAEPRSFEESKDANDDAGNDGFWSAPDRGADASTPEPPRAHEPSEQDPIDLFATSRSQEPTFERLSKDEVPPARSSAREPRVEQPTRFERSITPPHDFVEESPVDRNITFQDDDFRPRSSLRYSHHGAPPLPVVREESPAQMESGNFERHPYTHDTDDMNRDSAFVTDSPIPPQMPFTDGHIRDSGVHLRDASPAERAVAPVSNSEDAIARLSWPPVDESTETVDLHRSQRPKVETPRHERDARAAELQQPLHEQEIRDLRRQFDPEQERATHQTHLDKSREPKHHDESQADSQRTKSPRRSLTPEEKKHLHRGIDREGDKLPTQEHEESPSDTRRTKSPRRSLTPEEKKHLHRGEDRDRDTLPSQRHREDKHTDLHRTKTIHQSQKPDSLVKQRVQRIESPDFTRSQTPRGDKYGELSSSQRPKAEKPRTASDNSSGAAAAIGGSVLGFAAARQASREGRPDSAQSLRSTSNINRLRTPDPKILRPESVGSSRSSGTPPLRRSDRKSGDLRSLSQRSNLDLAKEAELAAITAGVVGTVAAASSATNPQANEGRVRAKEMADVYDGFGEGRMGSPRSPTRPHSMRRRQSMQVLDLEQRLEQLAAENRALADAKAQTDRILQTTQHASSALVERDSELDSLKRTLAWLQNEVTRLTEVNDGLTSANITLGNQHNDRYNSLESQHSQATRELQQVRDSHNNLTVGMEGIVKNEVQTAVQEKDAEIKELRAQLEAAKEQIVAMQRQILESKGNDSEFLTVRDEDYFDNACQQLCQHVQQWVLRFSKFSDMRACRLTSEINNDKIIDRLDNAILDGSDVDSYLADRVKRRDVFMSMTMTMVWEFIFTRYLFGMDREQRQKLKSLEKLLSEVGPAAAVHQWRATTLTLLSKREAFVQQREQDTLAVVHAVMETLTEILPPPSQLEQQIQEQLTRVMKAAVDLSIEMRTQRAEYMMLPPLQPEYDANGDLASKVSFNAALMNERSGDTVSNEDLETQKAVVRVVLFPLVVKKGDDSGEGDEEIVVCPAQVLVAKPKKQVRIFSNDSQANHSRMSMQSSMPADYGEGSVI